jgi:hypothetical protein
MFMMWLLPKRLPIIASIEMSQLPRSEGQSLQLYSLNPSEINTRYIGHQERVSWPRLPVGRVDTSDQEVALARQPLCIRTAPGSLCDAAQLPGGAKQCPYFSAQAVYPLGA